MNLTKNFSKRECACKCCGECHMDSTFMEVLQDLRDTVGFPLIITSGYRCDVHNRAVKGANSSQHIRGKAVDIDTSSLTADQKQRLMAAIQKDKRIKGVGVATSFIHIDSRETPAHWVY